MGESSMSLYPELQEYGIRQEVEKSDLRIHICVKVKMAYVFLPENGVNAINTGRYLDRLAGQSGINYPTASGSCVPPGDISGCIAFPIPEKILVKYPIEYSFSCKKKGKMAVSIARAMLWQGLIRFPTLPQKIAGKDIRIGKTGTMHIGNCKIRIKCDFNGGDRSLGGTGNLFLQTAEANPLGIF